MSQEAANAFIYRALTDTALQSRMAALGANDINGLLEIAISAGYPTTIDDLKAILETTDELSDSELDMVAGGLNPQPLPPRVGDAFVKLNPGLINGIIIIGMRQ